MNQHKIVLGPVESDLALTLSAALIELVEPAADAVTRFETGLEQWRVEAYYEVGTEPAVLARQLGEILGFAVPSLAVEMVPAENWVVLSQKALPPVTAGRFTVHGSHDRRRIPFGPNSIEIDAGEAFGTAHHATTEGCLNAIDRLARRGAFQRILDLGCGSGVLAIAAARAWPHARVVASDNDPEAVRVASENVRRNRMRSHVRTTVADGVPRAMLGRGCDLVLANILAGPLVRLAPKLASAVVPGGVIVLSGLLVGQAAEVIAAYRAYGCIVAGHQQLAGWSILTLVPCAGRAKLRGQSLRRSAR